MNCGLSSADELAASAAQPEPTGTNWAPEGPGLPCLDQSRNMKGLQGKSHLSFPEKILKISCPEFSIRLI